MKLGNFESIQACVFNDMEVNISSHKTGCDFTLLQVDNKIEVINHHRNDEKEVYFTFRNGEKVAPDLEGFLNGWSETVNADDCVVYIY